MDNKFKKEVRQVYTYEFKVNRSAKLLEFMLQKMDTLSRNVVKSILHDRKVLVNGTVTTQFDYQLSKDDEVKISKNSIKDTKDTINLKNDHINKFRKMIIFENKDYIAINKPAGLLSVESDKERESAYLYCSEYISIKNKKLRPYILHRIDKETSGVLCFAKSPLIQSKLKLHWNEDVSLREYYCVCKGVFEKKKDRIVSYLKENQNNIVYITKNIHDKDSKIAITNYKVIKENKEYSLLKVTIETGRKNQIRVQLNSINHPILGDTKYAYETESPLDRLCLHASKFEFLDPVSNKLLLLQADCPKEFYNLVR